MDKNIKQEYHILPKENDYTLIHDGNIRNSHIYNGCKEDMAVSGNIEKSYIHNDDYRVIYAPCDHIIEKKGFSLFDTIVHDDLKPFKKTMAKTTHKVGLRKWMDIVPFLGRNYRIAFEFWIKKPSKWNRWKFNGALIDFQSDGNVIINVSIDDGKIVVRNLLNNLFYQGTKNVETNKWLKLDLVQKQKTYEIKLNGRVVYKKPTSKTFSQLGINIYGAGGEHRPLRGAKIMNLELSTLSFENPRM